MSFVALCLFISALVVTFFAITKTPGHKVNEGVGVFKIKDSPFFILSELRGFVASCLFKLLEKKPSQIQVA